MTSQTKSVKQWDWLAHSERTIVNAVLNPDLKIRNGELRGGGGGWSSRPWDNMGVQASPGSATAILQVLAVGVART